MTPKKLFHWLAILALTLLMWGCASPTPTQTVEASLAAQIDDYLASLVKDGRFSGSILVAKDGRVLISKGYGMANLELEVPNTPQTKFRLADITKQFTAMAILQLQQQGKLNVQDPICQYISDCPEAWQPITIHHLLTHTSGIPDFLSRGSDVSDFVMHPALPSQIVDRIRDLRLDFGPGEKWSYSNSGYILLGHIIQKVSGDQYAIFLQHNIFGPLQMADTGYDDNLMVIKGRASGYNSAPANAVYIDMSVPYASKGLYSTVEDLYRWDQALYTEQLISKDLLDKMWTSFVPIPNGEGWGYGYGWFVGGVVNRPVVNHGGQINGFSSSIIRYPDDKVVTIVLSNFENIDSGSIGAHLVEIVFGEE